MFGGYQNNISNSAYSYSLTDCAIYNGQENKILNGPTISGINHIDSVSVFGKYNYGIKSGSFILGKYNKFISEIYTSEDSFIIGGGTSDSNRLNRFIINKNADLVLRNSDNESIAFNPNNIWKDNTGTTWSDVISGTNKVKNNWQKWDAASNDLSAIYNLLYENDKISQRRVFTLDDSLKYAAKEFGIGDIRYIITNDSIIRLDKNSGFTGEYSGYTEAVEAVNYVKEKCNMTVSFDEYNTFINNVQINFYGNILPSEYMQSWLTNTSTHDFPVFQIPMFQSGGSYYNKIKDQTWYGSVTHYIDYIGNTKEDQVINASTRFLSDVPLQGIFLILDKGLIDTVSGKEGWGFNFNLSLG